MKVSPDLGKERGAAVKFFTQMFYARENFGATVLAKTVAPKFSKPREFLDSTQGHSLLERQ